MSSIEHRALMERAATHAVSRFGIATTFDCVTFGTSMYRSGRQFLGRRLLQRARSVLRDAEVGWF